MFMDNEVGVLDSYLKVEHIRLNTTDKDEHVTKIKRNIRVIKEWLREIHNTLPYDRLPSRMIAQMMLYIFLWLNGLPVSSGISNTLPPVPS